MLNNWRLFLRGCTRLFLAAVAVTHSALAPALGLGEITLYSALNQPLRADIALVDAEGLDENDLSASLATADEFKRAGVERGTFLKGLQFTPVQRGNLSLIRVTSSQPVTEPFLNFLVQLNQANGRLVREYTVLLDPPGSVSLSAEPVIPSTASPNIQPDVTPSPVTDIPAPVPSPVESPAVADSNVPRLENRQLQASIAELKVRLEDQGEQIAEQKKQLNALQSQWREEKSASAQPITSTTSEKTSTDGWWVIGLAALVVLLVLGWLVRRSRLGDHLESAETLPWEEHQQEPRAPAWRDAGLNPKQFQSVSRADQDPEPAIALVTAAVTPAVAAMAEVTFDEYRLNLEEPSLHPPGFDLPDASSLSLTLEPLSLEPVDARV